MTWMGVVGMGVAFVPTARAEPPAVSEDEKSEALKKIGVVRSMKLAEALELEDDDDTRRKLDRLLSDYDIKLSKAEEEFRRSVRRLRRGVRRGLDDQELNRLSDTVLANRERLEKLRLERMRKAGAILNGAQRARLMLFLPTFERKVRRAIQKTRRNNKGGDGSGDNPKRKRPRRNRP
ncbi:MAG: hypothetical protein AAFX99_03070 [Myxococcota bacterium]